MRWLLYRLRSLWHRPAREADLEAELQFHLEAEAEEQIETGLPPDRARQAALRALGNVTLAKEDARAVWTWGAIERLLQDVRYALRVLARQRAFTATALATIVLIVGGTTAVFTLVNAVLLRPLPYPASNRLVMVRAHDPRGGTTMSYRDVERLQEQVSSVEAWGLYRGPGYVSTLDRNSDRPLDVQDMRITPELFRLLGVQVALGRPLLPGDAIEANPDVAVIGHDLWQTRFGGTPDVLGKSFELRRGRTLTIVGVAAPGADVPGNWLSDPIVWHPIRAGERAASTLRFTVLARLKPGRSIGAVNAEIAARRPLMDSAGGVDRPVDASLLLDHIVGDSQRILWVFFGAMACVLLIGVANLVSLQLVRNAARERELGLRAALGASRWRLVRQLLVESLLLGAAGGAGGLLVASTAVDLVTSALPAGFPRADQIALDPAVWVFAALLSALVGATIGFIPVLRSIKPGLIQRVQEGGGSATLSHRRARVQRALIAFETAAALVLLVGAGLLVNSFGRLISQDAGMRERDLWVVRGTLPMRYRPPADTDFWLSAVRHLRELPDVESAALVVNDGGPLRGGDISFGGIVPDGQTAGQGRGFSLSHRAVGGSYFSTLGIRIVSGRPILDSDTARSEGVVVLNQAAAAALWPGDNPLGRRLGGIGRPLTVVGIVPDFKLTRLDGGVSLQMYTSLLQQPPPAQTSTIMVRAKPGATAIADRTKAILVNLDKDLSHLEVLTMARVRWQLLASERFRTAVLLVFAGTAAFLALIGVFGLVSYTVAQRHREIGLRVALGATYSRVVSLMLRQALIPAGLGIAAGILGALAASRLLAAFLFGVQATDPATFSATIGLFFCAVLVAALLPALRSFRIDPAAALRHE
ncbi:MAG TPA: ADOP family duplicated permease [Vicinamibacterales bacterium]|nr:ADOP family duplicated permease [Vicinamibacterales bacterium]